MNASNGVMNVTSSILLYITSGPSIDQLNDDEFVILVPSFILIVAVVLIGLPGNILTIWVYKTKMRRTASRIFILALAICDLINCVITMPVEISIIARYWSYDYPLLCTIGRTLTYVFNGTSALLLCGIAFDRFRKICRPLKPVFTPRTTKFICCVSFALVMGFYVPGYIIYGTNTVNISTARKHVVIVGKRCQLRDEYKNSKLVPIILGVWFLGTVAVLFALVIIYSLIGRAVFNRLRLEEKRRSSVPSAMTQKPKLRRVVADDSSKTSCSFDDGEIKEKSKRQHQSAVLKSMSVPVQKEISRTLKERFRLSAPNSYTIDKVKKENMSRRIRAGRTTVMLFSVTVAYIISFLPFVIIVILRTSIPDLENRLSMIEQSIWQFCIRSYVINCAINPILYGFFNKDFREKTKQLISWCLLKRCA
ncbi:alpha-2C adrenergic receptor-like [Dreissena polymorpha]|uniref:G-protein coupled receptors family 1 profile domain-containing protein n=1 Tax=Dreissena polymorpha TaxID=45954 RepID=A0A9D4BUK1_DREPO|nr:alpha-2C adrenergic receptor-like [Dreissena polymorpha]XP_052250650.1 alpha-2C adrenergic receptor-like [Dreissena polymorpha]XP_052250651.1 alpha-2C adrenergic receptor-like [Dreissena polymorpha]KAH3709489.1 hypothetical protein DPMN_068952 [Dreissena polymorpha]